MTSRDKSHHPSSSLIPPLSASAHSSSATSPVHVSRDSSPFTDLPHPDALELDDFEAHADQDDDDDDFAWDEDDQDNSNSNNSSSSSNNINNSNRDMMPPDSRRQPGSSSYAAPLLSPENKPTARHARSRLRESHSDTAAARATKQKYTYAAAFLVLSLISFTIQTETAVYIQHSLHWNKAYCMLYFTHGSWILLWPAQLAILRLQKLSMPWDSFWRRHKAILRSTCQMVEHQTLHIPHHMQKQSPIPYFVRMTSVVTCALTVAGGSWYVAVNLTTASDLTAIYNCSAFFAYAFAIPLLGERFRWNKVFAVAVAIVGVLVVAYGDSSPSKHGSKSGGGAGGPTAPEPQEASNRFLGNLIIGVGSVLYGFYEVLYKRVACPPEGCSPARGMILANTFGSLIGLFTLTVLWIPLPILHYTGIETFQLPTGEAAWMLLISVMANATFSGSFLVLISLTSPVLSSVAALLTIFLVAVVDQLLPPPLNSPLSAAAVAGGLLIIVAFLLLSWATYREMDEERRKKELETEVESDVESVL
jgi:drug/metabolite transporter (DMT)-like permease